jgi:hypothetical protein
LSIAAIDLVASSGGPRRDNQGDLMVEALVGAIGCVVGDPDACLVAGRPIIGTVG